MTNPVLQPGETFVKWKVEKLLGAGGMGEVFLARDEWLCRDVALKVLPVRVTDDPMYVDRMRREAAAGTTVRHPNLVEVIDGGLADGKAYLVMEYLPNAQTLRTAMRRGRIALERALPILVQICDGVRALHIARILHRDLKPENVMILEGRQVKVIDFGLAKIRKESIRTTVQPVGGGVLGTAQYMSPELIYGGKSSEGSDVYALGLIAHEMLTGGHAFQDEDGSLPNASMATARHTLMDPPRADQLVPDIPGPVADVIYRALAKHPDHRPTARELGNVFATALREILAAQSAPQKPSAGEMKTRRILNPSSLYAEPSDPSPAPAASVALAETERLPGTPPAAPVADSPRPPHTALPDGPRAASPPRVAPAVDTAPSLVAPSPRPPPAVPHLATPGPTSQPVEIAAKTSRGHIAISAAVFFAIVGVGSAAIVATNPQAARPPAVAQPSVSAVAPAAPAVPATPTQAQPVESVGPSAPAPTASASAAPEKVPAPVKTPAPPAGQTYPRAPSPAATPVAPPPHNDRPFGGPPPLAHPTSL